MSILLPTISGAFNYRRLFSFARILYFFVLFTFGVELSARILYEFDINNMFLFHFFSFGEVTFLCLIYRNLIPDERWKRYILQGFILFQTISILNLLFFEDITHFNSVQRYFEMLIIYTLLAKFILRAITEEARKPFLKDPAILLTLGFMIYFLGTLFLFIYGNDILSGDLNNYWIVHGVFNIFLNLIFSLVFFAARIEKFHV